MNYTITAPVAHFSAGILELNKDQAAARKSALKHVAGNKYAITAPVQFKAGEVVGYAGTLPKALSAVMIAAKPAVKNAAAADAER